MAQEVWITVHRRWAALRPDASTRAWLAAITRRVASRHRRGRERARRRHDALAAVPAAGIDGVEPDAIARIEAALSRMDPAQREVFLLTQIEELSGPEVAGVLGVPLNTVYSRLRLARARLAESLASPDDALPRIAAAIAGPPPAEARSRVWIGLGLAVPVVTVTSGGALATWAIVAGVAIAVGSGIAAIATRGEPTPRAPVASSSAVAPAGAPSLAPAIASSPVAAPPVTTPAAPRDRSTSPRAPTRSPAPDPGPEAAVASDLAAEAALLAAARRALAEGRHDAASTALTNHRARFVDGELAIEREALQVRTWCAAGATDRARALADRLVAAHPDAPAIAAIRDACR